MDEMRYEKWSEIKKKIYSKAEITETEVNKNPI
jgi:hypothetical protein